jgi:hypothetical protein
MPGPYTQWNYDWRSDHDAPRSRTAFRMFATAIWQRKLVAGLIPAWNPDEDIPRFDPWRFPEPAVPGFQLEQLSLWRALQGEVYRLRKYFVNHEQPLDNARTAFNSWMAIDTDNGLDWPPKSVTGKEKDGFSRTYPREIYRLDQAGPPGRAIFRVYDSSGLPDDGSDPTQPLIDRVTPTNQKQFYGIYFQGNGAGVWTASEDQISPPDIVHAFGLAVGGDYITPSFLQELHDAINLLRKTFGQKRLRLPPLYPLDPNYYSPPPAGTPLDARSGRSWDNPLLEVTFTLGACLNCGPFLDLDANVDKTVWWHRPDLGAFSFSGSTGGIPNIGGDPYDHDKLHLSGVLSNDMDVIMQRAHGSKPGVWTGISLAGHNPNTLNFYEPRFQFVTFSGSSSVYVGTDRDIDFGGLSPLNAAVGTVSSTIFIPASLFVPGGYNMAKTASAAYIGAFFVPLAPLSRKITTYVKARRPPDGVTGAGDVPQFDANGTGLEEGRWVEWGTSSSSFKTPYDVTNPVNPGDSRQQGKWATLVDRLLGNHEVPGDAADNTLRGWEVEDLAGFADWTVDGGFAHNHRSL